MLYETVEANMKTFVYLLFLVGTWWYDRNMHTSLTLGLMTLVCIHTLEIIEMESIGCFRFSVSAYMANELEQTAEGNFDDYANVLLNRYGFWN